MLWQVQMERTQISLHIHFHISFSHVPLVDPGGIKNVKNDDASKLSLLFSCLWCSRSFQRILVFSSYLVSQFVQVDLSGYSIYTAEVLEVMQLICCEISEILQNGDKGIK